METIVKMRIKQVMKGDQNAFADIVELYKDKNISIMLSNARKYP